LKAWEAILLCKKDIYIKEEIFKIGGENTRVPKTFPEIIIWRQGGGA